MVKTVVDILRKNDKILLVVVIGVICFLIGGAVLTDVSPIWGKRVIMASIGIMVYLMCFLGIDPISKGMGLTLLPFLLTMGFMELMEFVPRDIYIKWLYADTVRGSGPESLFFLIALQVVLKVFGVNPYMLELARQQEEQKKKDGV